MMKGNNVVELNSATMIEAVQHYFDTVLYRPGKSPQVRNVIYSTTNQCVFRVLTADPKAAGSED